MSATGRLAFVGDAHLSAIDAPLQDFLRFLDGLGETCARIVLMGDLFDLWIGRPELEEPHHRVVVEKLAQLRRRGVVLRYLEGNRDYRIAAGYTGSAFDDSTDAALEERCGGHRLYATHGDLVNTADRQYRLWRRLSRSRPVWFAFNRIPRSRRLAWANRAERRLRSTNLDFKRRFPEAMVRAYAERSFAQGYDALVLGHFHVERDLAAGRGRRIFVLPEWKESRRHLEVHPDGAMGFVDSAW